MQETVSLSSALSYRSLSLSRLSLRSVMYERLVVAGAIHVAESERHGSGKNRDTLKNAANRFLQLTNSLGIASASERARFLQQSVEQAGIRITGSKNKGK